MEEPGQFLPCSQNSEPIPLNPGGRKKTRDSYPHESEDENKLHKREADAGRMGMGLGWHGSKMIHALGP